jgi:hypothetical protein
MTLPVGSYRVRLVGPAPANESRLVTLEVQADGVAASPVEQFTALTPAEYFEQYLSSSAGATSPEAQPAVAEPGTTEAGVAQ